MAHFAPDDVDALTTLDVVCRGEIVAGGAGEDFNVRARVDLRARELKDPDPADRAALAETLTGWMASATAIVADALAAVPQRVRR